MMNFWDKITGNDMTRTFEDFEYRAMVLPAEYELAWKEIKGNLWIHSNFTGRNLMTTLDSVLTMLEETAINGLNIQEVLGNNIEEFCVELIGKDNTNTFRDKCRRKLNNNIKKKLSK